MLDFDEAMDEAERSKALLCVRMWPTLHYVTRRNLTLTWIKVR